MTVLLGLFVAMFAVVLAALMAQSRLVNHLLLGVAGVAGLMYGFVQHGWVAALLPMLIVGVAAVQAASAAAANRAAKFTPEEETMLAGPLSGLGRSSARRLLDEGVWLTGRPGDMLIREGECARQLVYLAKGKAEVRRRGFPIGRVGPGQLVGEAAVLGDAPATATVTLTAPSRFWCAQGQTLNAYLAANPDALHALEHGFAISLRQKLEAMNAAAAPAETRVLTSVDREPAPLE